MARSAACRIDFPELPFSDELLTSDFLEYFTELHDSLAPRVPALMEQRKQSLARAHDGQLPTAPAQSPARHGDWKVPEVPEALRRPGIEISGPCSITPMFINALNPGPDGRRAIGDLDDDEDSAGHRLTDTLRAAHNRAAAVRRELTHFDEEKKKEYRLKEGPLPFLIHRERGLHLDEPDFTLDGKPVNAAIFGTALSLFHAAREQTSRDQGVFFYLPKLEFPAEARLFRDLFDKSQKKLPWLAAGSATLRAIPLVESLPCVFHMEEMLYELGPYAAGLNAARWDLKASLFEHIMTDAQSVWPDRFGVDIKTTPFLANIFRRLIAVCRRRGGVAIGGMATALPSSDPEVNALAAESIRKDKEWEAAQGFIRAWVAHIFHMSTAAAPFANYAQNVSQNPDDFPIRIEVPEGPITVEGTRRNCHMVLEYLEGWLAGRGAKGIDSLAGKPGLHPALMEDLATFRMSVAQLAQRIRHRAATTSGPDAHHDQPLVKKLLESELADILSRNKPDEAATQRYKDSLKIALRFIKNYEELNFASLGSYSRPQLARIAAASDAF